jgi:hypothetical protein
MIRKSWMLVWRFSRRRDLNCRITLSGPPSSDITVVLPRSYFAIPLERQTMILISNCEELALIAEEIGTEVIRGAVRYPGREG